MNLPSTGGNYETVMQPGLNPLAIRKGITTDAFFRDYVPGVTNLAAPEAGLGEDGYFSPYALDGQVRLDLKKFAADGTLRTDANLGFWHAGSLGADGIGYDPRMDMEEVPTAQSLRPARVDITKEGEIFTIVCLEQTPFIRYLVNELPLLSVPDLGQANLTIPKPMEATICERQAILFGFDGDGHRFARTIPRCAKSNVREFAWKREGREGTGVTVEFAILPCPMVNKPVLEHFEGSAWRGLGGYAIFPAPAPVATAITGQKASVVFTQPTGKADPFTLKVYKTVGGVRTLATMDTDYPQIAGTTVTAQVTGVTTGETATFDVEATGTNGLTTKSLDSNVVTGIA